MHTKTDSEILIEWLEKAIETAGSNQTKAGEAIGLKSQMVNRILSGERDMKAHELIKFSATFKAPIPALSAHAPFGGDSAPARIEEPEVTLGSNFTKEYNRAFAAALQIEREEFSGDMPLDEFITAVTIGLKSQKRSR